MDHAILNGVDAHGEFCLDGNGDPIAERHRTDDPNVWGLYDVARGRTPLVPTTIYKRSGDSASGVVGLLLPGGHFRSIHSTRIGQVIVVGLLHDVRPSPFEPFKMFEVVWDGAAPCREFTAEVHGGGTEVRKEHSRGLLLGDYQIRRDIDRGAKSTQRRLHRNDKGVTGMNSGALAPMGRLVDPHRQEAA